MDKQKIEYLEEQLKELKTERETLERQIAFSKNWISKIKKRGVSPSELESEIMVLNSLETEYSQVRNRMKSLEARIRKEQSKEFEFGWKKVETSDLRGGTRRLYGSELKALRVIAEAGGEVAISTVSRRMGIGYDYARLLCISLGRADYIDIIASGRCRITEQGEKELERNEKGMEASSKEQQKRWRTMALDY